MDPQAETYYAAVERIWDSDLPVHGKVTPDFFETIAESQFRRLKPGGRRLLDIGCGTGDVLALLAARGLDCYGFDVAEAKVREAEKKTPGRVWKQSFLDPFANGPFDYVVCFSVVQYCRPPDVAHLLRTARDALTSGGQFLIAEVPVLELIEGANGVYYRAASEEETQIWKLKFEMSARTGSSLCADGTFFHSARDIETAAGKLGLTCASEQVSAYRMTFDIRL